MVLNNQSQLSLDGEGGLYVVGDPKEPQSTQERFILDGHGYSTIKIEMTHRIPIMRTHLKENSFQVSFVLDGQKIALPR